MSAPFKFYVALMALVDDQGYPLHSFIKQHLAWLLEHGVDGILINGTNGEFSSMTLVQRQRYVEAVVDCNPNCDIMIQIGASNFFDVLELQSHALHVPNLTSLLWMPPFYFPQEQMNGLDRMTYRLLERQPDSIPLYLYHFPKMSGVSIEADWLEQFPGIAGLKDSSGDFDRIAALNRRFPNRELYAGTDFNIQEAQQAGCSGMISGMGNVFPRLIRQAIDAPAPDKTRLLENLRVACSDGFSKIPAFKAALNHLDWVDENAWASCLPPLDDLSPDDCHMLINRIQAILEDRTHDAHFQPRHPLDLIHAD